MHSKSIYVMKGENLFFVLLLLIIRTAAAADYPPPTSPTNTRPWPSQHQPTQSWPTNPLRSWPPTMSPYPTLKPHDAVTPTPNNDGKHLSAGAIAGIVVASLVVVGLAVGFVVFFLRRRRNRPENQRTSDRFSMLTALNDADLEKKE